MSRFQRNHILEYSSKMVTNHPWEVFAVLQLQKLRNPTQDTGFILPTESRRLQVTAEYASMHNNNLRITPALSDFVWVCTYMQLTDARSASELLSTQVYFAGDLP